MTFAAFQKRVWEYYQTHPQSMPWRPPILPLSRSGHLDPYTIMVSEVMLQQTQVSRVAPKFEAFMQRFPDITSLAQATLAEVLTAWSGLGYNRRAKYLWQATQQLAVLPAFPMESKELIKLPGIGLNTAAAIVVYSFNRPVVFIETNIRSVFLHHFYPNQANVGDSDLLPLIQKTLDQAHPREWYWALMDYGRFLKTTQVNPSQRSKHHAKQSTFEGSRRQLRGAVLRYLAKGPQSYDELYKLQPDERLESVLSDLLSESLIQRSGNLFTL